MKANCYQLKDHTALKQLDSVGDWIRWATSVFNEAGVYFGHGTDNAWDEAVQLVLQTLNLPIDTDSSVYQNTVLDYEREQLLAALRQRVEARLPLPYVTRQAWCGGLPFYVDQRVLIPRSPFFEWIEKRFEPWIDASKVSDILEIGTGSACLAILVALHFPEAKCDAVDISEDALAVAAINVAKHDVADQVSLLVSDVFSNIPDNKRYDIIFSNPPYVSQAEVDSLPPEYHHEPRTALQAEDQGLAIVIAILLDAAAYLKTNGILVVELGYSADVLQQRFPGVPFVWLEQDQGGEGLFLLTREQLLQIERYVSL